MMQRQHWMTLWLVIGAIAMAWVATLRFPYAVNETTSTQVNTVHARCPHTTWQQRVTAADLLLIGTVEAVIPGTDGLADAYIKPVEVLKGDAPASLRVATQPVERNASPMQGLRLQSGEQQYLLLLRKRPDGRYTTTRGAGSRAVLRPFTEEEQQLVQMLRKIAGSAD